MISTKQLKSKITSLTRRINALINIPYFGTLDWQPISELETIIGKQATHLAKEAAERLNEPNPERLEFVHATTSRLKENTWVKAAEETLDQFNIKVPSRIIRGFVFNIYGTNKPKYKLLIIGKKEGSPNMLLIADPDRKKRIQTAIETKLKEADKTKETLEQNPHNS